MSQGQYVALAYGVVLVFVLLWVAIIATKLVRLERGSALGALKTPRSYRTIPLPDSVGFELARHIETYPGDDPDGLLFQAALGGRLRRDGWNRRTWKPAVTAAGRY